jgi:hypothetical protein
MAASIDVLHHLDARLTYAEHPTAFSILAIVAVASLVFYLARIESNVYFTANRRFWWEPSLFSRLRWAAGAQEILDDADAKV